MQTLLSEGGAQLEAMQTEQCCRQGHQSAPQVVTALKYTTTDST